MARADRTASRRENDMHLATKIPGLASVALGIGVATGILTRGSTVKIPAGTLLKFRLQTPFTVQP
jgi:hypothetical protein